MNNRNIKDRLYRKLVRFVTFEIDWRSHGGKGRKGYCLCDPDLSISENAARMRRLTTERLAILLNCSERQVKRCLLQLRAEKKIIYFKVVWGLKIIVLDSMKWEGTDRESYFDAENECLMPATTAGYHRHVRVRNDPPKRRHWRFARKRVA